MPFQVAPNQVNSAAQPQKLVAPEFLLAVNDCTPKMEPALGGTERTQVEAILEHIVGRLTAKDTFAEVWAATSWEPMLTGQDAINGQIDEDWAKRCTELMVLSPYLATNQHKITSEERRQSGAANDDIWFYKTVYNGQNPFIPVGLCCQQLCTYALMLRGLDESDLLGGISANANGHAFFAGGWQPNPSLTHVAKAVQATPPLRPGSLVAFNPKDDGSQEAGSHVAFVLRTAPRQNEAQFFDTGALSGSLRSRKGSIPTPTLGPYALQGSTFDNCLWGGNISTSTWKEVPVIGEDGKQKTVKKQFFIPYRGMGALSQAAAYDKMAAGFERAKQIRTCGVARLAIFARNPQVPIYVSPVIPLWDPNGESNFHHSRLLWSLRGLPGHTHLSAIWEVYIPTGQFGQELRDTNRGVPLSAYANRPSHDSLLAALWLSVDDKGNAVCPARLDYGGKEKDGSVNETLLKKVKATPTNEAFLSPGAQGATVPPLFASW